MTILRGGVPRPIADFYDPEKRKRAEREDRWDIAPIERYPKDRHRGLVLLVVRHLNPVWAIGRWDSAAGVWLGQRGERLDPTHFTPMPGETIEIDDA
jgi:hypothetical protein